MKMYFNPEQKIGIIKNLNNKTFSNTMLKNVRCTNMDKGVQIIVMLYQQTQLKVNGHQYSPNYSIIHISEMERQKMLGL